MTPFSIELELDASPDALLELYVDPAFQEFKATNTGSTRAKASRREESDGSLLLIVETWRPAHWGSGEEEMRYECRFPAGSKKGSWKRVVKGMENRTRVEGTVDILARGDGGTIITRGEIDIRVPLMGRRIERRIVDGIAEGKQRELRLWREGLTKFAKAG